MKAITFVVMLVMLTSCNLKNEKSKNVDDENTSMSATNCIGQINTAQQRIHDIIIQKVDQPKNENEYRKNDSLMNLEGIALDNFIESLVGAYGNVPTDSIFEKIKNYGGYIPPALAQKIQPSDWLTVKGKVAKGNYDQFLKYYEQFDSLVGFSFCDRVIVVKSPEGEMFDVSKLLSNGTYLVDIWASWCSPCRRFNRNFKKNYAYFKGRGIETISISTDKNFNKYKHAADRDNVPWLDFNDHTGGVSKSLKIQSLPFQFVVKNGIIVKVLFTGATENQLREYLESNSL